VLHEGPRSGGTRAPGDVLSALGTFLRPGARNRPRRPDWLPAAIARHLDD